METYSSISAHLHGNISLTCQKCTQAHTCTHTRAHTDTVKAVINLNEGSVCVHKCCHRLMLIWVVTNYIPHISTAHNWCHLVFIYHSPFFITLYLEGWGITKVSRGGGTNLEFFSKEDLKTEAKKRKERGEILEEFFKKIQIKLKGDESLLLNKRQKHTRAYVLHKNSICDRYLLTGSCLSP